MGFFIFIVSSPADLKSGSKSKHASHAIRVSLPQKTNKQTENQHFQAQMRQDTEEEFGYKTIADLKRAHCLFLFWFRFVCFFFFLTCNWILNH